LAHWGFKEQEAILVHPAIERPKVREITADGKSQTPQLAECEAWVADRFDDLRSCLSGDSTIAYYTNGFMQHRIIPHQFIETLKGADRARWSEILATPFPWDVHFAMSTILKSLGEYQNGNTECSWVVETGERVHAPLVDLLEKLSQGAWAADMDWQFCFIPCVQVLEAFMRMGRPVTCIN
jgi:hypothetical protein